MARASLSSPLPSSYRTTSYLPSNSMSKRYGTSSFTDNYTRNDLSSPSTRNYMSSTGGSTYSSSYNSSPTRRFQSPPAYTPNTSSIGTSKYISTVRKRAPSPVSSTGRPLPTGPGPQDAYGRKIAVHDNLGTYRTSTYRVPAPDTSSRSRPIRADHTTVLGRRSPSVTAQRHDYGSTTTLRKRTSSVSDLTRNYENLNLSDSPSRLSRTKHHGSNLDLSNSRLSTPDTDIKDLYPDRTNGKYGKRSVLPNITNYSNGRTDSGSTSPDRSRKSSSDDASGSTAKRAVYASSRHNSQSSIKGGNSLDYNANSSRSTSPSFADNRSDRGLVGLRNLGNTCFMNSVIQSLSNTRPLLEYCLESCYEDEINKSTSGMKGALIKAYGKMMKTLWKKTPESYMSPSDFKSQISKFAPRFIGYSQQDAQEFLVYLLEGLHEDLNRIQQKKKRFIDDSCAVETISAQEKAVTMWKHYITCDNSKVVDVFVGQLKSSLTCTVCNYKSNTFDPFWQLSLPIKKGQSSETLRDCLDLFTQQETLEGDERPMCAKCQQRQRCTKRFYIQKFPKILVIHLKRFNQGAYIRSKLSTFVDFPMENLDLAHYAADHCNSPVVYNLYAIVNHSGSTVGGHYTADAKHPYSGAWNHFNDIRVSPSSKHNLKSADAYVLFYELADHSARL